MKQRLQHSLHLLLSLLLTGSLLLGQPVLAAMQFTTDGDLPQGSTCENPIVLDILTNPLVDFQINSEAYGNHYSSGMVTPSNNYLAGNDIVFQFTLPGKAEVVANLFGSWAGLVLVATCPDAETPAPVIASGGGSSGGNFTHTLDGGTYFLIAGTWAPPQYTDMTINLSATLIPLNPTLAATPTSLNMGMALAGEGATTRSVSMSNLGLADAVITQEDITFSGAGADAFSVSLPDGSEFPLTIEFGQSKQVNVHFQPLSAGDFEAAMLVTYNHPENATVEVNATGTGYLPFASFYEDFSGYTAPALPSHWNSIVQAGNTTAAVVLYTLSAPVAPPNHVSLFNGNDVNATLVLVSPAVTNLEDNWVTFFAKMGTASHTGQLEIGFLTDPSDFQTFTALGIIDVDGTYRKYSFELASLGEKGDDDPLVFPENGYIGFRHIPNATSRRMLLDAITYQPKPDGPVVGISQNAINFGDNVWVTETATQTLEIINNGVGILSLNETDFVITGVDAEAFGLEFSQSTSWPVELGFNQKLAFQVSFTPSDVKPYSATLEVDDQLIASAVHQIPLQGSGYDPTVSPDLFYDFLGTFPPQDWRRYVGPLVEESTLSRLETAIWGHGRFANLGDVLNSAYIRVFGSTRNHWLVTPPIDLGDGETEFQLEFDLALTHYNTSNTGNLGAPQRFVVVISTDNGLTWSQSNALQSWVQGDAISNTGETVVIDLASYSGVVKLAFYAESTATSSNLDLFVTDVRVRERQELMVSFNVEDENGQPIPDASITLNDVEHPAGQYQFDVVTGTHTYAVNKEGFYETTGTVAVDNEDVVVSVTLEVIPPFYPVTFNVTDGQQAVEGARVRVNDAFDAPVGDYLLTNEQGVAVAELENGAYSFEVTKSGFIGFLDGSLTVDGAAVSVEVILSLPDPLALPFFEDFNGGSLPEFWLVKDQESNQSGQTWDVFANLGGNNLDGTPLLGINSDAQGSGTIVHSMIETPAINATGFDGLLVLTFDHFFRKYGLDETGRVDVWDGSQWQNVAEFTSTTGTWATHPTEVINITTYANDELRVRFHYNDFGAWGWYWAVDNLSIEARPAFSVTFNIADQDGAPVDGAQITFDDEVLAAGTNMVENVLPGTYSFSVEKEGYYGYSGQVVVEDGDVTVNVVLEVIPPPTYSVTFEVEDADGNPITDAQITFNGVDLDAGVYVIGEVEAGIYAYSLVAEGFLPFASVVEVVADDVTVQVVLETIPLFNVTFVVEDEDGNAIPDAVLTFDGETFAAGIYVVVEVLAGTWDYTLEHDDYYSASGQVIVTDDDVLHTVVMQLIPDPTFTITFMVEDEDGNAIPDAVLTFDGENFAAGVYVVMDVLAGNWDYTLEHDDYYSVSGQVNVADDDVLHTVVMQRIPDPTFTLTFVVEDEDGNALADAMLTFDGEALSPGEFILEELPAGTYSWEVSLQGYHTATGDVTIIDNDVVVEVTLEIITSVPVVDVAALNVFPNPATAWFQVKLVHWSGEVTLSLFSQSGHRVMVKSIEDVASGQISKFNVDGLSSGIYFLRVQSANAVETVRIVIQ
jgi:hypothetical protein